MENEAWLRVFHQTGNVMPDLERVPLGNTLTERARALLPQKAVLTNEPATFSPFFQPYSALKSLVVIPRYSAPAPITSC